MPGPARRRVSFTRKFTQLREELADVGGGGGGEPGGGGAAAAGSSGVDGGGGGDDRISIASLSHLELAADENAVNDVAADAAATHASADTADADAATHADADAASSYPTEDDIALQQATQTALAQGGAAAAQVYVLRSRGALMPQ
eukprot:SAG11_NODE_7785_length_1096_cov_2.623872_1_plen_145_part_00